MIERLFERPMQTNQFTRKHDIDDLPTAILQGPVAKKYPFKKGKEVGGMIALPKKQFTLRNLNLAMFEGFEKRALAAVGGMQPLMPCQGTILAYIWIVDLDHPQRPLSRLFLFVAKIGRFVKSTDCFGSKELKAGALVHRTQPRKGSYVTR
ncbi:hypothetical protein E3U23_01830 [Erythrobacter litoralis]|nr:hypothetical protein [Erythrobacter litoralis]MDG6077938.1 hypothetical protein [Erythrobacter litoralis]